MTTSTIITKIRLGIPLITTALTYESMKFNYGFSIGQISTYVQEGFIDNKDWTTLSNEAKLAMEMWQGDI